MLKIGMENVLNILLAGVRNVVISLFSANQMVHIAVNFQVFCEPMQGKAWFAGL
jgi:hypothetical protein